MSDCPSAPKADALPGCATPRTAEALRFPADPAQVQSDVRGNARNEQRLADQAKAFSDAVKDYLDQWRHSTPSREVFTCHFADFILPEPEPDPLVELMAFNGLDEALAEQRATNLRKDAADLGYKIIVERIEQ